MANASTSLASAAAASFVCLEKEQLLAIIAYQLSVQNGNMTASAALSAATSAKFTCLQFEDLIAIIANGLAGGSGSGGLSSGSVTNPALIPAPTNTAVVNAYFSDPTQGGNGNVYWWTPGAAAWQ